MKEKKNLGGSKALDSFSKLIISCESFFHPTNSGKWTNDVSTVPLLWIGMGYGGELID
jgi:proteasome activator subunit 4